MRTLGNTVRFDEAYDMNDEYKVRCYKIDDNVISVKCFVGGE